jgi:hypothetical protein
MSRACRANITDRSYTWQSPDDITRILSVEEVLVMLVKEFNGHKVTTFHPQADLARERIGRRMI